MAKKTIKLNENELRNLITECVKKAISEGNGYDMSTPEGRAGAENWMRYIISQSESGLPREAEEAAEEYEDWASNYSMGDYPTCVTLRDAFKAGVEWAIKNIINE